MIMNMSGGAGGKVFAVIGVTYPSGSVCTCANGSKTLTAKDTSGAAMFTIPSVGEWTVTATSADGAMTKSATVNITAEGQVATVVLIYEVVLYANGTFDPTITRQELITNGKITYGERTIDCTMSGNSVVSYSMIAFKEIDLTQFSTISIQIDALSYYKDGSTIAVVPDVESWNPKKPTTGAAAYTYASESGVTVSALTVDVSAINGVYDVVVGLNTQGGAWGSNRTASYSKVLIK